MHKKLRITVEGKVYDVTVEELTETGQTAPAYPSIAGTGAPTNVATSGPLAAPPPPPKPAAAPQAAAGAGAEICPLGGVVDSVDVAVGQSVAEGDKIVVVEAMKMKTPVYAHRGGTVTSIAVKPGDAVETGAVLLTIG
ncbi:MAG TPA: biotin/lipoyl-containing protein [Magnetospirillum sp.]|nr:biotin/lipoyl-containing protein [Magnetospirillum sp.]